jgi:hypothetical protein
MREGGEECELARTDFLSLPSTCLCRSSAQMFSVPKTSRRTKPFIDHILTFSILDNKVWFRNYQVRPFVSSRVSPLGLTSGRTSAYHCFMLCMFTSCR